MEALSNRNLLKNPTVEKGFDHWYVTEKIFDCKKLEPTYFDSQLEFQDQNKEMFDTFYEKRGKPPKDLKEMNGFRFEEENTSNETETKLIEFGNHILKYTSTYYMCSKYQIIDLHTIGLDKETFIKLRPVIRIVDNYTTTKDCGAEYRIQVALFDENFNKIEMFAFNDVIRKYWRQIKHKFMDYSDRAKYLLFHHGSIQFWGGEHGVKITNPSVKISMK